MKKHVKKLITHPLFSGSAIMVFGSNAASAINYLYHLIIGRLLGPSSYGELVALISVLGLLGIIPGAVSLVIVKEISSTKNEQEVNNLISWFKQKIFIFSLIFSILVLILSPFIYSFLHISKVSYLFLIAIILLFSLQSGFNRSILQGLLKFKEMVISILAENGLKLLLSILLIYIGFQVDGVVLALLISGLMGLYITNSFLKYGRLKSTNFSPNISYMLKFAIPVVIQTIATTSLYTTDLILVKHFFSSHDAGIYASLSTLGKIIFFATGPITAVMFPIVSQRKARGQNYRKIFFYSFFLTGVLSIIISTIYGLVPSLAINLLYGRAYLEAKSLLVGFGIFMTLFTLSSLLINFNLSLGKTRVVLLPFIAAIIQITLIWLNHQNLFIIVFQCICITALLLVLLLIYSLYGKTIYKGDKIIINNSTSL